MRAINLYCDLMTGAILDGLQASHVDRRYRYRRSVGAGGGRASGEACCRTEARNDEAPEDSPEAAEAVEAAEAEEAAAPAAEEPARPKACNAEEAPAS